MLHIVNEYEYVFWHLYLSLPNAVLRTSGTNITGIKVLQFLLRLHYYNSLLSFYKWHASLWFDTCLQTTEKSSLLLLLHVCSASSNVCTVWLVEYTFLLLADLLLKYLRLVSMIPCWNLLVQTFWEINVKKLSFCNNV